MTNKDVLAYAENYLVIEFYPLRKIWNLPYLHIGFFLNQNFRESYFEEEISLDCKTDEEVAELVKLFSEKVKTKFAQHINECARQGGFLKCSEQ